jgi:hypothetical protein
VSTRPPTFTPIPTGDQVIDRNLRRIQEAFARITQEAAAPAASQSYVFVGSAVNAASKVFAIPDGAVRLQFAFAMVEDFNTVALSLDSSFGTYYQKQVGVGRTVTANWTLAGGGTFGSPSFTDGDIGLGTVAIPTAFFSSRTHDDDGTADDIVFSGGTGVASVAKSLTLATTVAAYAFSLWAELAA